MISYYRFMMVTGKYNYFAVNSARESVFNILYQNYDCEKIPSWMAPKLTFKAQSDVLNGEIVCFLNWKHLDQRWLPVEN